MWKSNWNKERKPELGWQEQYQGTCRRAGIKRSKMWLHIVNLIHIRKVAWKGYIFKITWRDGSQLPFCFCPEDRLENYVGFSHSIPFGSETLLTLCVTKAIYSWPDVLEETSFPFIQVNTDQLRTEKSMYNISVKNVETYKKCNDLCVCKYKHLTG